MSRVKKRAKKANVAVAPQKKDPPTCARCGRRPSHPHYGGGSVGGVYCNRFCARATHLATGCGVYRIDAGRNYVEIIAPMGAAWFEEGPPSPSVLIEQARAIAQPKLELLLASGMRPIGGKPPPKTTADCVEHIFGPVKSDSAFVLVEKTIIGERPVDMFPAAKLFLNGTTNGAVKR